ncbi:MAG: hypothetical protein S4CHLAM37_03060 [Chlamydiia bacterium]|nr:hypothetical protein [Chlamydiia bacterium]
MSLGIKMVSTSNARAAENAAVDLLDMCGLKKKTSKDFANILKSKGLSSLKNIQRL